MRCIFPDRCRVWVYYPYEDGAITRFTRVVYLEALPCRVSFRRYPAGEEKAGAVALRQGIRLYSPSRLALPAGCEIEFGGRLYRRMGESAVYPSHRESDFVLEENA